MECLNHETIERYAKKMLPQQEQAAIDLHLNDCPVCRQHIDEAMENESLLSQIHTHQLPLTSHTLDELPKPQPAMTTAQAQEILGRQYTIVKKIGRGASGEVFQAMDPALDRPVAVKFLHQETLARAWQTDQWLEGKFMSRADHPNIAHIYHIGQHDGVRYIVMEWIDGLPLTQAWEKEPLAKRLSLYMQVLEAIDTAHRKGIVHRDIKPSNILVTAAGQVKVLDFGIALAVEGQRDESNIYRGTPAYSAPEQISNPEKIGPATDVFVLGILLYQLLTDTVPFAQTDSRQLFEAICSQHPELPSAIQETVPLPLQNICLKALEKDADSRYRDANALANDVSRFLRGEKVWSRPSFVNDQIQQEIFYHRQRLEVWHHNGMITEKEHDKLENIYERVVAPADLSIVESRKLSFSQVCLYLGGWITILGCAVLLSSEWSHISRFFRPIPAMLSVVLMIICGRYLWTKNETRLSVGFLATGCLLLPVAALIMFGHYSLFGPDTYTLGSESVAELFSGYPPAPEETVSSAFYLGNLQLLISAGLWLAASLFFLRIIRSSIFVIFCILSFLGLLSVLYVIGGMMETWIEHEHVIALRYLYPGVIFFAAGMVLDRKKMTKYAWPLSAVGLLLVVACSSFIALSEATLFFCAWANPDSAPDWYTKGIAFLSQADIEQAKAFSFIVNGLIYLVLAWVCRRQGTRLQRTLGQIFNWLGPLHLLVCLRILDQLGSGVHQDVYRFMLPVASLAFVFGSVSRQMKSFVFSGLGGLAISVQKFTSEYFEDVFSWPIALILVGFCFMLLSWWVPRLRASQTLKRE
ncbi:MAG: DUF2157 domain-containing protein [Planctomycetota bacterium]|jgi:serine/threonine protein kinase